MNPGIDEFRRRKNSPLRSQAGFLSVWRNDRRNAGEMGHENDPTVTTSHLLVPNEPRRAASSLPIWLPNSTVLVLNSLRLAFSPAISRMAHGITATSKIHDAVSKRNQNQK